MRFLVMGTFVVKLDQNVVDDGYIEGFAEILDTS